MAASTATTEASSLKLARVAFTGRLASMTRAEAHEAVKAAGGVPVTTVSRRTSMLVVGMDGWPLLPDGTVSRKLRRAEALNRGGSSIRIVSEAVFLERAGLKEREPLLHKSYPAQRVCELLGIEPPALARWELFGLVRSAGGLYDFQDIVSLRTIAELIGRGADPQTIGRSVRGLASVLPGTERPLSQLKVVMEHSGTLLAELGELRVAPDGQLMLNFDEPAADREVPAAPRRKTPAPPPPPTPEVWLERGHRAEEQEQWEEAGRAYREALALRPHFPEAHFNLGNVLRGLGKLDGAEERYRTALELDPSLAVAWYNLADLLDEQGNVEEAIGCLRRVLEIDPDYADAHFNLAYLLEQVGRRRDAASHWSAYLDLDPSSEWADIARKCVRNLFP